jgi:glycerol-3-phosphate acyltransferase PlsY
MPMNTLSAIASSSNILLIILAYLIGSIPFGYIITKKIAHKDIRKEGSGNIGATNVTRIVGKKWGLITFLLDAFKGLIIIILAKIMHKENDIILFIAYFAVLGHIAPIWFKFVGGKGVATAFAVLAILMPKILLILLVIWCVVFKVYRVSSLAAVTAFVVLPILVFFQNYSNANIFFSLVLSTTILYKHRTNIQKLLNKTENRF